MKAHFLKNPKFQVQSLPLFPIHMFVGSPKQRHPAIRVDHESGDCRGYDGDGRVGGVAGGNRSGLYGRVKKGVENDGGGGGGGGDDDSDDDESGDGGRSHILG